MTARLEHAIRFAQEVLPRVEVECRFDADDVLERLVAEAEAHRVHPRKAAAGELLPGGPELTLGNIDADDLRLRIVPREVPGGRAQPAGNVEDSAVLLGDERQQRVDEVLARLLVIDRLGAPVAEVAEVAVPPDFLDFRHVHGVIVFLRDPCCVGVHDDLLQNGQAGTATASA